MALEESFELKTPIKGDLNWGEDINDNFTKIMSRNNDFADSLDKVTTHLEANSCDFTTEKLKVSGASDISGKRIINLGGYGGATGRWIKMFTMKHQDAHVSGRIYAGSNVETAAKAQSTIDFAIGRRGTMKPIYFKLGDGASGRMQIYLDDTYYSAYIYQSPYSHLFVSELIGASNFGYHPEVLELIMQEATPTGTLVWDSDTGESQGMTINGTLTAKSLSLANAEWFDLVLQNGFVDYAAETKPQYCKIGNSVLVRGLIKHSTGVLPKNTNIATLPTEYRPTQNEYYLKYTLDGSSLGIANIVVGTNGIVKIDARGLGVNTAPTEMSLSLSFAV